jgi:RNA polymerase sigma-70 factor (ECF subfamily)
VFNKQEFNKLYQYACSLTNNSDEAFDFVHDALIQVQTRTTVKNSMAYIKVVIRNNFFAHYKKNQKETPNEVIENQISSIYELESLIIHKDSVRELLKVIQPEERELLYQWAVEGKTVQEISLEQDVKLGTLLSRISRLKKKIIKLEDSHGLS